MLKLVLLGSPLFAMLFAMPIPSGAALGDTEASIDADAQRFLPKETKVSEHGSYRLHEMTRGDGSLIREYVNSDGKVFGVSWKGPVMPNLSQLLGSNFATFHDNAKQKAGRRRLAVVHSGDLVVESSGHPRAFFGRAYLNSMLPAGVTEETVQ